MALKYLSFDLETIPQELSSYSHAQLVQLEKKKKSNPDAPESMIRGTDPFLGQILCIGIYYKNEYAGISQTKALYNKSEKEILEDFWKGIEALDSNTKILSFNGFNFDIPWIRIRSLANGIRIPNTKLDFFNLNPFKNTPHIDLMVELKGDKYNKNISVNLDLACDIAGVTSPKDGIDGSMVYQAYLDGRLEEIAGYVQKDVKANGDLFERLIELNLIK